MVSPVNGRTTEITEITEKNSLFRLGVLGVLGVLGGHFNGRGTRARIHELTDIATYVGISLPETEGRT